jgi:hypothetical protein
MKERLFLDGIDISGNQASVNQSVQHPLAIFANLTQTASIRFDAATVVA